MEGVGKCFLCLNERARRLVRVDCGFAAFLDFVESFSKQQVSKDVIRALLDRFWDTTNTFHFSWGELALTPMEFGAISGLRMSGRDVAIPMEPPGDLGDIIGPAFQEIWEPDSRLRHSTIRRFIEHNPVLGYLTDRQQATLFIWYMFEACLFSNPSDRALWEHLWMLADFEGIGSVQWGVYAYSHLISSMRDAVRGKNYEEMVQGPKRKLCGVLKVLLVIFQLLLHILLPYED
ncbi:MAG: hypothetical protein AB1552_14410 [Nitrospirota bacterium]